MIVTDEDSEHFSTHNDSRFSRGGLMIHRAADGCKPLLGLVLTSLVLERIELP